MQRVEDGAQLVANAGTTMGDILAQVRRVAALIGTIHEATQDQTRGIEQVGSASTTSTA